MQSKDGTRSVLPRRKLLGGMMSATGAGAAALLGLNAVGAAAGTSAGQADLPEDLFAQARLRNYKTRRSSSWDRTGGNADAVPVEPGRATTVLEATGAGVVTHIWFTIASPDPMHLKNLVLRAWWDGESTPSVEVPIGDFFGLGLGEYFLYQSALMAVASIKALNAYFQMPFSSAARITVTNEGMVRTDSTLLRRRLRHPAQPSRRRGSLPRAVPPGRTLQGLDQRLDQQRKPRHQRPQEPRRQGQLCLPRGHGQGTFCGGHAGRTAESERVVRRGRRHDLHRRRRICPPSTEPALRTTSTARGTSVASPSPICTRRALHRGSGADWRPLLPLPLAH